MPQTLACPPAVIVSAVDLRTSLHTAPGWFTCTHLVPLSSPASAETQHLAVGTFITCAPFWGTRATCLFLLMTCSPCSSLMVLSGTFTYQAQAHSFPTKVLSGMPSDPEDAKSPRLALQELLLLMHLSPWVPLRPFIPQFLASS